MHSLAVFIMFLTLATTSTAPSSNHPMHRWGVSHHRRLAGGSGSATESVSVDAALGNKPRRRTCIGNPDTVADPDIVCQPPFELVQNATNLEGSAQGTCCVRKRNLVALMWLMATVLALSALAIVYMWGHCAYWRLCTLCGWTPCVYCNVWFCSYRNKRERNKYIRDRRGRYPTLAEKLHSCRDFLVCGKWRRERAGLLVTQEIHASMSKLAGPVSVRSPSSVHELPRLSASAELKQPNGELAHPVKPAGNLPPLVGVVPRPTEDGP